MKGRAALKERAEAPDPALPGTKHPSAEHPRSTVRRWAKGPNSLVRKEAVLNVTLNPGQNGDETCSSPLLLCKINCTSGFWGKRSIC